jgi:SAM-dependent methyltransferase
MDSSCPVCGSTDVSVFFELLQAPVHCNLLWQNREDALAAPRGDLSLGFCGNCSHIYNTRFDPQQVRYSQQYENALDFSPRFQDYIRSLASNLVHQYHLYGKDLLEIGCGRGEFLHLLCELGNNRGVGFDPSAPEFINGASHSIQLIQDYYSEKYAHYPADLVCSRQTLEHIEQPVEFLEMLRRSIGSRADTIVFFEVPNSLFILRELSVWDIIYEHPSYYSRRSIAHLFNACGYQVLSVKEAYAGQFLTLEGKPGNGPAAFPGDEEGDLAHDVEPFTLNFHQKVSHWRDSIEQLEASGKRAVIWGAGSKGVSFLNFLKPSQIIPYVVDINPRKHGMYIAGSGQEIVSPVFLQEFRPDIVIVVNSIYKDEIQQQVDRLGLHVEFYYP